MDFSFESRLDRERDRDLERDLERDRDLDLERERDRRLLRSSVNRMRLEIEAMKFKEGEVDHRRHNRGLRYHRCLVVIVVVAILLISTI